jgi:RimJ/RimL family protein N-acetyltransferase
MAAAAATGVVARVRASVAPDNAASLGLLDHLGFVRVGERPDGTGAQLWVLERPVDMPASPERTSGRPPD